MQYGYCRISRPKQSIERQIRNIKAAYPEAVIVQEVYTRTRIERKEWSKLSRKVKAGDTIIFDSVSRMSGNAADGFAAYEDLYGRGVSLVFLKEPHINTDTYKKALKSNVPLTGGSVDLILAGVNQYLLELAKEQELGMARSQADTDPLTGVKSRNAYAKFEQEINAQMGAGKADAFALVVCDVNNLKIVNDT